MNNNDNKNTETFEQAQNEIIDATVDQTNILSDGQTQFNIKAEQNNVEAIEDKSENIIAGAVGAFLFALVGGILYFIIYQMGFIAGICGLITVVLSSFGYQLFAGKKGSVKGIVFSIIMSVLVLAAAEFFCLSYAIYNEFKADYGINFFDAVRSTPAFLSDGELLTHVIKDLLIAYALGAVASLGTIKANITASKHKKSEQA